MFYIILMIISVIIFPFMIYPLVFFALIELYKYFVSQPSFQEHIIKDDEFCATIVEINPDFHNK